MLLTFDDHASVVFIAHVDVMVCVRKISKCQSGLVALAGARISILCVQVSDRSFRPCLACVFVFYKSGVLEC
jgi:hypothetical protein